MLEQPNTAGVHRRAFEPKGKFRNTYYYVVLEQEYTGFPLDATFFGLNDEILAMTSSPFKRAVDIEGTGKLTDGRVLNYAGKKDGTVRYHFTAHAFGHGVGDCPLAPFHTVAVDPDVIPLGSLVSIQETTGMVLPDGSRHNGLWRAEDVGGAIRHDRIDLFVGEGDQGHILQNAGITNLKPLTVRIVAPPSYPSCVDELIPR